MYKKQKGFTLVEMIIVTVIIGILAGMVITVINIPRIQSRSRDSKRIGDLKRIQSALELYFADFRVYPLSASWVIFDSSMINATNVYISDVPQDPRGVGEYSNILCFGDSGINNYGYYYRSNDGAIYILGTVMELDYSTEGSVCSGISNCSVGGYNCSVDAHCYCVQNPM